MMVCYRDGQAPAKLNSTSQLIRNNKCQPQQPETILDVLNLIGRQYPPLRRTLAARSARKGPLHDWILSLRGQGKEHVLRDNCYCKPTTGQPCGTAKPVKAVVEANPKAPCSSTSPPERLEQKKTDGQMTHGTAKNQPVETIANLCKCSNM